MWVKTYGNRLVNLDSICMIDTVSPTHEGGGWHVEAWWAGEDGTVTFHVGTIDQCVTYMELLAEFIASGKPGVFIFTVTE